MQTWNKQVGSGLLPTPQIKGNAAHLPLRKKTKTNEHCG